MESCTSEREITRVMRGPQLRARSVHEAGHAVIAVVLGVEVLGATIDAEPHVMLVPLPVRCDRWDVERRILVAMAGPLAHGRDARSVPRAWVAGGRGDVAEIDALLEIAGWMGWANDRAHDWSRYESDARELVKLHWPAIERVAAALLAERTLDGARVRELVHPDPA